LRPYIRQFTKRVLREGLAQGVCLNINFPLIATPYKGVKVCRMAHGSWINEVTRCHHPRGHDYYWMVGHYQNDEPDAEDTDNWALNHGFIAITPTHIDVTHYEQLQRMKETWEI
jgi:5'-nucleotidase